MAQIVYYFSAALSIGSPSRPVSFTVPTGNFGDIFAGYVAKRMGLPIERLVIATNRNDILARALATGRYEKGAVHATISPSMDIQVSSNFERLIFESCGRDAATVSRLMAGLAQSGAFELPAACLAEMRETFVAGTSDEAETSNVIRQLALDNGYIADPHTAVGLKVASERKGSAPMVTLATAHPAKFPDAVESASGIRPLLPEWAGDLMNRTERYDRLPNSLDAVQNHVLARIAHERN